MKNLLADIIRYFHTNGSTCQDPGAPKQSLGLIVCGSQGPCTKPQVEPWGWTYDLNAFLKWLSAVPFISGEFSEAALADGLSSALKIIAAAKDNNEAPVFGKTHCILVTSYKSLPEDQILDENKVFLHKMDRLLVDATSVARKFVKSFVSLSVISPKQSRRLREIFRVGNVYKPIAECCTGEDHNYLILLSDNFVEAHNALSYRDFIIEPAENCTGKEIDFGLYSLFF